MPSFAVVVHGLVYLDDKILVMKRSEHESYGPGLWDFPGGRLEYGETPQEGLFREVLEEAGIEVKVESPVAVHTVIDSSKQAETIIIIFRCSLLKGRVKINLEHTEYRWVNVQEALKLNFLWYLEKTLLQMKNEP